MSYNNSTTNSTTSSSSNKQRVSAKTLGNYILLKGKLIGKGAYAEVFEGYRKDDKLPVAIKVIPRNKLNDKLMRSLESEINVMKKIKSDYVIKLYEVHRSKRNFYLILEICYGGELNKFMKKSRPKELVNAFGGLKEQVVRKFLYHLAKGLKHMNDQRLVHRDLKPANLLLSKPFKLLSLNLKPNDMEFGNLKIADFGFAREIKENDLAQTLCGTPLYMAPEILASRRYDSKADLWSVGAILYEMLFGRAPYLAANTMDLQNQIRTAPPLYPSDGSTVSLEVVSLLKGLLQAEPSNRFTFEAFYNHPYMKQLREEYGDVEEFVQNVNPPIPISNQPNEEEEVMNEHLPNIEEDKNNYDEEKNTIVEEDVTVEEDEMPKINTNVINQVTTNTNNQVNSNDDPSAPSYSKLGSDEEMIKDINTATSPSNSNGDRVPSLNMTKVSTKSANTATTPRRNSSINPFVESTMGTNITNSPPKKLLIMDKQIPTTDLLNQLDNQFHPLESMMTKSGRFSYPSVIFDFDDLKCNESCLQFVKLVEQAGRRSWVIAETAFLMEKLGKYLEALALYIRASVLLQDTLSRSQVPELEKQSDRLVAINAWMRKCFSDFLRRSDQLRFTKLSMSPNSETSFSVNVDDILYKYAVKLAKEAAQNEYLTDCKLKQCIAMYSRAKLIFEHLLSDAKLPDSNDRTQLETLAKGLGERIESLQNNANNNNTEQ
ncbi:hypothetical protein ABK040_014741 [Willaertia magna]